jgi:TatD DNase family protein
VLNLQKHKVEVPVIFHGARYKYTIAQQVLKHQFYLSFGAATINVTPSLQQTILNTPLHLLFCETDTRQDVSIEEVYLNVAKIKNLSVDTLIQQINLNKQQCFKQ